MTIRVRGLTLLSKQILLWASIIGVVNLALSIGTNFFISAFGSTQAQAAQNAGLLNGGYCLSLALVLAVLPFIAGWRATLREGTWKEGGITGIWSVIVSEVLGLIVTVILATFQGQLAQINGDYFVTLLGDLVVPLVLSFSFGAAGGYYNIWQRRRAERRQEALTSSS